MLAACGAADGTSSASGVVLMLGPARKRGVCPMRVAGKTDQLSIGRWYHSATSSPTPGALPESLGQPPNLLGGWIPKPLRHGFPKLACDWFAPCERRICHYGYTQRPVRKIRVCPMRVAGKTGQPSLRRRYRLATSSPAYTYLFCR